MPLIWQCDGSATPMTLGYLGKYYDGVSVMARQILTPSSAPTGHTARRPMLVGVGAPTDAAAVGVGKAYYGLGPQKLACARLVCWLMV